MKELLTEELEAKQRKKEILELVSSVEEDFYKRQKERMPLERQWNLI